MYSNTVRMPQYNIAGSPWGHSSIDDTHKRDLMNMLAINWSRNFISGMLQLEKIKVAVGKKVLTQVLHLVTNKDKVPV